MLTLVIVGVLITQSWRTHTPAATALSTMVSQRFAQASQAAAKADIALTINSGWRSVADQQTLFDDAVVKYGSAEEAGRWVLPADESAHVRGEAIDVGPATGAAWLERHGARYGLCRVYENEPWHFETLIKPGGSCPALRSDATES